MLDDLRKNYNNLKRDIKKLGVTLAIVSTLLTTIVATMACLGGFKENHQPESSAKTIDKIKNAKKPKTQELLAQNSQMKIAMDQYRVNREAERRITVSRSGQRGSGLTMGDALTKEQIEAFLKRYGSPMTPYAQDISDAGKKYNVNPALVIAIAGVESTFGKHAPGCNAWGWGHSRWSSWPQAIDSYTQSLGQKYLGRCQTIEDVNRSYCPNGGWSGKVKFFYNQIMNT